MGSIRMYDVSVLLLLLTTALIGGQAIQTKYACGYTRPNSLYIKCPTEQIISVRDAVYGRLSSSICPGGAQGVLNCSSSEADRILRNKCDGRNRCAVKVSDRIFGRPCSNATSKYLEVSFACYRSFIPERKCFHMLPCQSTSIMGRQNGGFPQTRAVGRMYTNSDGIITWENTAGSRGRWQWLGWKSSDFLDRFVKISFSIKFIDRKPRSRGYEIKICGQVYRNWAEKCTPGNWCGVNIFSRCADKADNYVTLNFGGVAQRQKIQVANFKAETRPIIEKVYTAFDGSAIIMNSSQGLPHSAGVGMIYPGRIFDKTFRSNEIFTWQNTGGKSGPHQWFGWSIGPLHFASKILRISFGIKFEKRVPELSLDFGIRVHGVLYNEWIKNCTKDEWCFVNKVIYCQQRSGHDGIAMLVFNSINHTQTIHVGKLRVVVIKSEGKIFNVLPTNPQFMGREHNLPQNVNAGRMYIDNKINNKKVTKKFQSNEIIAYENTMGERGNWQWMGWQNSAFIGETIIVRFWIYFHGSVPRRSPFFGLSICGKIYNEFVGSCLKDTWCFVMETTSCDQDGNGSSEVRLTFDSITKKRVIRVSQFHAEII